MGLKFALWFWWRSPKDFITTISKNKKKWYKLLWGYEIDHCERKVTSWQNIFSFDKILFSMLVVMRFRECYPCRPTGLLLGGLEKWTLRGMTRVLRKKATSRVNLGKSLTYFACRPPLPNLFPKSFIALKKCINEGISKSAGPQIWNTPISKYRLKTDFDVIKSVEKTRHIVGFNNVVIEKHR